MTETVIRGDPATVVPAGGPVATPGGPLSYIHWGPVFAGAVAAAALSAVLMAFGSSIGLGIASPSPTWRDASVMLALLSGIWVLVIAVGSSMLGGYIAGRVRSSWRTSADEVHFRDGIHGLLVWAMGVLIGAAVAWASAATLTAVNAATSGTRGTSSPTSESFFSYELDRLFRSDRRPETADTDTRAEAGRILVRAVGRRGISTEDRGYLTRLVSARTGLAGADADRRVEQVLADARNAAAQARRSAVILAFMTAASLAAGAAAAWVAAGIGGQHRDREIAPPLRWQWRRRLT
jgi:hypothetical protein